MALYYKMGQLLRNVSGFLLQNVTTLLQIATVIAKCNDFITKGKSDYKIRHLLQNSSLHSLLELPQGAILGLTLSNLYVLDMLRTFNRHECLPYLGVSTI